MKDLGAEVMQARAVKSAMCHLEADGKAQLKCLAVLLGGVGKLQTDVCKLQNQVGVLTMAAAERQFLATFRSPLRQWLARRANALGVSWPMLAGKLDLEEDEISQPYTDMLKASLQSDSYTWEDWLAIESIAEAASSGFHLGKKVSAVAALQSLDRAAHRLPDSLQHTEGPLRKALKSLVTSRGSVLARMTCTTEYAVC